MVTKIEMLPLVLLAGGCATRLYPLTKDIPKSLLEVQGKPFIEYQLDLIRKNDIKRVIICTGHLGEQIKKFIKNGKKFDLLVEFSFDGKKLLGTGGAIKKAIPLLDENFLVMYGDSYLDIDFRRVVDYFHSFDKEGLMTVFRNENRWGKSNIVYESGRILEYDKVNTTMNMRYIDYGLGVLTKRAFRLFDNLDKFDLSDVYRCLIERNEMLCYEVNQRFYEMGSPEGLEEMRNYLINKK